MKTVREKEREYRKIIRHVILQESLCALRNNNYYIEIKKREKGMEIERRDACECTSGSRGRLGLSISADCVQPAIICREPCRREGREGKREDDKSDNTVKRVIYIRTKMLQETKVLAEIKPTCRRDNELRQWTRFPKARV